jgi:hypothetical protein
MKVNASKLKWIGFGVMSLILSINAQAQATLNSDNAFKIQSSEDYVKIERLIEGLATRLYQINQEYPGFTYRHNYQGDHLVSITVDGIENREVAEAVGHYLLDLETLGAAIQQMDYAYVPGELKIRRSDILNELQAAAYTPAPELLRIR